MSSSELLTNIDGLSIKGDNKPTTGRRAKASKIREPNPESKPNIPRKHETIRDMWRAARETYRAAEENVSIKQARAGIWVGPESWVDRSRSGLPHPIPPNLVVDELSGPELRAAMSLGYFSPSTLTERQRERMKETPDYSELQAAKSFFEKYFTASEDKGTPKGRRRRRS